MKTKLTIKTLLIGLILLMSVAANAGLPQLNKLFNNDIFEARDFSETIRTVNPEFYITRTKVDGEAFADLFEMEKKKIFEICAEDSEIYTDEEGDYVSSSRLTAAGWTIQSNGGWNSKEVINDLLGAINESHREKVKKQLPRFGTYFHLRVKNEQSEPYGWDLFIIADDLLDQEKGKVLVLKVYYSYY